jgi:hypothetical protein
VISKDCFTYLCPNRRIILGFFIKLSDSVLKSTESLNKSKVAVNTHRNASSDVALSGATLDPVELHVDRLRSLLLGGAVDEAVGGAVFGLEGRGRLRLAHFF